MRSNLAPASFGFWVATTLVVGNMIGSGIFLLPASLAPFGFNSLLAWLFTTSGAITIACVFARLSRAFPQAGGPYAYTLAAFGRVPAFLVIWGYWVSIWVANAAIAIGAVAYLTPLLPSINTSPHVAALATLIGVWSLTLVNARGVAAVGWVQAVTTVMKVVPLIAVAVFGVMHLRGGDLAAIRSVPLSIDATTAAATLTLYALTGLESATIPADKVTDPARTIPRATLFGTIITAVLYVLSCTTILLLVPPTRLATSTAPFVDVVRSLWGNTAATLTAVLAAISGFGALNGWILLQAELPCTMAKDGLLPKVFARESARRTPTFALLFTSGLITVLVLMNAERSLVKAFTFMILVSTTAVLVMYAMCALALLRLQWVGAVVDSRRNTRLLAIVGLLAALYSLWALMGAGTEAVLWGGALMGLGLPIYWLGMKRPEFYYKRGESL